MRCAVIVLLALLVGGDVAEAADAGALFREAREAYLASDFPRSVQLLTEARGATDDARLLAQIQLYLGVVRAVTGDEEEARQELRTALTYDPALEPDPGQFKPSIITLVRQVRAAMHGRLVVEADAQGASVRIDGKLAGTAPLRRPIGVGRHKVEVHARGRGSFAKQVIVALDQEVRVQARLGPPSPPLPVPPRPGRRPRLWTWIAAGSAVAALGTALGLGASANADYDRYRQTMDLSTRSELGDRIEGKALGANMLFGLTGALAGAAVTLFFVEGRP